MQLVFNDTTNQLGIIQACEDICGLNDAGISGNSSLLKKFTRYSNKALSKIWTWIFFSYGGIQFDDANQTDIPYSSDTLTAGKRVYANAAGASSLRGVAFKDAGGNYVPLQPITIDEIQSRGYTVDSFYSTSGQPIFYMPIGESTYIFPASDTTRSAGFRQYFDRGMVAYAATGNDARAPGFDANFHEAVSCGASIEWLIINKPDSRTLAEKKLEWADFEDRIKRFYRQKYAQMFPARVTVRDATLEAQ